MATTPFTVYSGSDLVTLVESMLGQNSGISVISESIKLSASAPDAVNLYDGSGGACQNSNISDNDIVANTSCGIGIFDTSHHNTLVGNTIAENSNGIDIRGNSHDNTITRNRITENHDPYAYGINIRDAAVHGNLIYDNYFENGTHNAHDVGQNAWNTSLTAGPNIIGGSSIGGNYWSDYSGPDANNDGIGDTPYTIQANGTDQYPLVP